MAQGNVQSFTKRINWLSIFLTFCWLTFSIISSLFLADSINIILFQPFHRRQSASAEVSQHILHAVADADAQLFHPCFFLRPQTDERYRMVLRLADTFQFIAVHRKAGHTLTVAVSRLHVDAHGTTGHDARHRLFTMTQTEKNPRMSNDVRFPVLAVFKDWILH